MVFTFRNGAANAVVNLHDITSPIELTYNLSGQRENYDTGAGRSDYIIMPIALKTMKMPGL